MSERKSTAEEEDLVEGEVTAREAKAEKPRDREARSVVSSTTDDKPIVLPGGLPVDLGPPPPSAE
jgi:hypothetical protein